MVDNIKQQLQTIMETDIESGLREPIGAPSAKASKQSLKIGEMLRIHEKWN